MAGGRGRNRRGNRGFIELAEMEDNLQEQAEEGEAEAAMEPPMIRNPLFRGEAGKEVWKELLKDSAIERRKFKIDKNLAWSFIVKHLDATINDKIKLLPMFDIHYADHNVLFLWNACREVATGVGAQSAGIILGKAFKLQMEGEN